LFRDSNDDRRHNDSVQEGDDLTGLKKTRV
jgi:hypothetical protein